MQTTVERPISPSAATAGLLSFVLIGAAQALYGPALPGFAETFALPSGAAGLILSVHNAGALLGVLSALPLAGRRVARWRAGGALLLLAAGSLVVGTASLWSVTLLGAFMIGLAYGALTIGLNSLYAVGFGARSPAMVNLLNAVFGIGAIVGPVLVAFNPTEVGVPFLILCALAATVVPLALTLDDRLSAPSKNQNEASKPRYLAAFVLLMALGAGVEAGTIGYAATYLVTLGETTRTAALVTSLFFLLFTLSRLAAIRLSLKLSPPRLVLGSLSLTFVLLLLSHYIPLAPFAVASSGAALGLFFPNAINWFSGVFGGSSKTVLIISGALLGGVVAPAIVSSMIVLFGKDSIVTTLLALNTFSLLAGGFIATRLRARVG